MSSVALRAAALVTAFAVVGWAQAPHVMRRPVRPRAATAEAAGLTPEMRVVVGHITANSLRGDVSFLASDSLEGRDTPSRGLDIAGEYIASQFRRLGLEPAGDDGYFQSVVIRPEDPDSPKSRNVAGILRGSDPQLKDTYVMLSAHYDHLGLAETGEDRIFNGANDDASGTASVLEIANALVGLHPRPKRSVLFILFCGEEKGLRGSLYYVAHPLVPLDKTVADLNLEQIGRTDAPEGPHLKSANVTGFDFSDMVPILVDAGKRVGIAVSKDVQAGDKYFELSDNAPIAKAGIPAHTLSVTYEFSDYHAVGDEWQKIDYDNMAKVDRMIAAALTMVANSDEPVHWNEKNSKAGAFVKAWKARHP